METTLTTTEAAQLAAEYQQITKPQTAFFVLFTDYADNYIKRMEKGAILTDKGREFSQETIRIYKNAVAYYKEFEKSLNSRTRTQEFNKDFIKAYELYATKQGLSKNSVSVYVSKLKAIGNILIDDGVIIGNFRKVKTQCEETTKISLSEAEITMLKSIELTNSETKVLDVFLIQVFSGLRWHVLQKFLSSPLSYINEYNGKAYIDIVSDKTDEQSVIPLHTEISVILGKYSGNMPIFSDAYVRRTIKLICKKAGIDQSVPVRITRGGKMTETLIPKYKLVSSHTGRRSFITLVRKHISNNETVMAMSGHKNEKQLRQYDKSQKLDRIIPVLDNEFFNKTF